MGSSSQLNSEYGRPKPHHVAMATSAVPRTERRKSRGCESVAVTRPPLRRVLAEVLDQGRGQRGGRVGAAVTGPMQATAGRPLARRCAVALRPSSSTKFLTVELLVKVTASIARL